MHLYAGKVLHIDLSSKRTSAEPLRWEWLREYWGGWGLAARYFVEMAAPDVDPLSPDNPVVLMTGILCGTSMPLASRLCLVSKSPHSGTIFESNVGGGLGPEIKAAGFDGLIITGRSEAPVYIRISDGRADLEDASAVWGKGAFETEEYLKKQSGSPNAKCLAIGPAGENRITWSCIGSEGYRQFGRGGAGAIFGAKNLKGVVIRGTGGVTVADMEAFQAKIAHFKETSLLTEDNLWARSDGTPILVEVTNEMGIHPTRNFTEGINEHKDALNADAVRQAKIADRACVSCAMACGKFTSIDGNEVEGPEYETLTLAGSNCGMNDLKQVIRFNRLCDDLGLDTISAGSTVAMAMEMAETGRADFGLRFGEPEAYIQVLEEIAHLSTDRGRALALGAKRLGERHDARDLAIHSKGLEFPAYDPRGNYGMGLAYATSERGGCHLRAFTVFSPTPFDKEIMVGDVVAGQNNNAIKWCMCVCDFWGTVTPQIFAELLTTGLGEAVTAEELSLAGERLWNLLRLYNLKAGFTAADDSLPERILTRPLEKGPHAGKVLPEADLAEMKSMYYRVRGWDVNGRPTPEKLNQLGLAGSRLV